MQKLAFLKYFDIFIVCSWGESPTRLKSRTSITKELSLTVFLFLIEFRISFHCVEEFNISIVTCFPCRNHAPKIYLPISNLF